LELYNKLNKKFVDYKFRNRVIKLTDSYRAILGHRINKKKQKTDTFKNRVIKLNTERKRQIRLRWKSKG